MKIINKKLDYKDQIQDLKNRKHLTRLNQEDTDEMAIDLIRYNQASVSIKDKFLEKEKELRAQIDKEEIRQAIKEMDQDALTHADRQKKRELEKLEGERENLRIREQTLADDIMNMEKEMIKKEQQFRKEADETRKESNDDIFATNEIKKKELDMAKERGEVVVKLQHKREQLEKERNRIMHDLDKITKGRMPEARPRSGLSSAGANIVGGRLDLDRADLDPAIKDKLIADQVKINYLREEQQKTNNMMADIDQLDLLENKVSLKNKPYHPKTSNGKFNYAPKRNALDGFNQALPPKAKDSNNIGNDVQDLRKNYVNGGGDDPDFIKKINDLDDFVNNRAPPKVRDHFGVENHEVKLSDYQNPAMPSIMPGLMPGAMPGYPPMPYGGIPPAFPFGSPASGYPYPPPVNPYANNPSLHYMDSLVKQTEEENKKLQDELERIKNDDSDYTDPDNAFKRAEDDVLALKNQILPNGAMGEEPFPEEFVFRQNDFRSEDLEVEERALMNIAAQEYDHLRLLSRLPVNSELYRFKMDQYKELSNIRSEIENVLQEQRLEKIRRDYEKQKYEDERSFNHQRWLEEQKREILQAKLRKQNGGSQYNDDYAPKIYDQPPETQNYDDQRPLTSQFPPKTAHPNTQNNTQGDDEKIYDPKFGFLVFFDAVCRIPRTHRGMQIVYGAYNNGRDLTDIRQIQYQDAETDPEQPDMNRVVYDVGHQMKHVQPHPSANLVIECQVPDNSNKGDGKYTSYGWTVVNLFDYTYDFHSGEFKLPLYKGQTQADIDCRDINLLEPLADTFIIMRLAVPGDELTTSQYLPEKSTNEYRVPSIHKVKYKPPRQQYDDDEDSEEEQIPMGNDRDYANAAPGHQKPRKKAPTEKDPFYR